MEELQKKHLLGRLQKQLNYYNDTAFAVSGVSLVAWYYNFKLLTCQLNISTVNVQGAQKVRLLCFSAFIFRMSNRFV